MDEQNFSPSIYDRVKTAIKSLNLDQHQLAEKLGLTQAAISKALNGKSDRSFQRLLVLLSKEYGMDFDTKLVLNQNEDITLIMVTHETDVARRAQRIVRINDGQIQSDIAATDAWATARQATT